MLTYFFNFSFYFYFLIFFYTFTFFELYFWILCPGPPEINTELKNQSVAYNSSLQFICSLSGFPTPEILWTKDGVNLGKNNTLTINRVSYGDAGQYTCSANNSEGKNESAFHITVTGKRWLNFVSFSCSSYFLTFFFFLFFLLSPFLNCAFEFYAQVLLKLILSSRISRLHINHRFSSNALQVVSLHRRYSGLRMGLILVTSTLSQLIEWVIEMLVNMHAALKTVKGKVNQLFILQSQVNVDLLWFPSVSLLIFYFFHTFTFFWIVLLNSMPRSSWN